MKTFKEFVEANPDQEATPDQKRLAKQQADLAKRQAMVARLRAQAAQQAIPK
jgi:hypothetical protein